MSQSPIVPGFVDLVEIGRGGFSSVWAATDEVIQRRVALKILDVGPSDHRRFERECRSLGALSEIDHIVPVMQATFTSDGRPCIVMRLMGGGSLAERIRASGPLPVEGVTRLGVNVSAALQSAHAAGIAHRDIKPENILFSADGEAAVADFGIAVIADLEAHSQTIQSLSPPHAPPERFGDGEEDPFAGDVYSLGSTLWTALSGSPPFGTVAEGGMAGLIYRVTSADPAPIERVGIPSDLVGALSIAIAKRPADRFASMMAFMNALSSIGPGARTQQRLPAPVELPPLTPEAVGHAPIEVAAAADPEPPPAPPAPRGYGRFALAAGLLVLGVVAALIAIARQSDDQTTIGATDSTAPQATAGPATAAPTTTPAPPPTTAPATSPTTAIAPVPPESRRLDPIEVNPTAERSSLEFRCTGGTLYYTADLLVDGDLDTGWGAGEDDGTGESVELTFSSEVHLTSVGMTPGYAKVGPRGDANCELREAFPRNRFVESVRYSFDDGSSFVQRFESRADLQFENVDVTTRSVVITILGTSRPPGADDDTIISEAAFFGYPAG